MLIFFFCPDQIVLISTTTSYMARSSIKKECGSIVFALNTDKAIKKNAYAKFYFPNRNTGISK